MTTQPAYLTLQSGTSRYLTQSAGTNYYLTLQDPAPYDNDVDLLLAEAVWYIDAHDSNYSGGQSVPNMGTAGTALNAQMGSGTGSDTNDPKWLAYSAADGAYAYLPGVASNYLSVPDEAALNITGDIDLIARVNMDDWTPAAISDIIAKLSTAGNRSYRMSVSTTGALRLQWTTDGTTVITATSTATLGLTDGTTKWLRATLDVDNGAGGYDAKFYTSDDGASWTQLGATVTGGTTTSIAVTTVQLAIGSDSVGTSPATGKVYRAIVKDGIDGTTVLDVDTSVLTDGSATSFTATTGQTVTVNRSTSGRKTTLVGGWAGGGSLWLFGTDDYLETIDDPAIDFGASDSFTVLAVVRQWATTGNDSIVTKKVSTAAGDAGWALRTDASENIQLLISDGTLQELAATSRTAGALLAAAGVHDVSLDATTVTVNGTTGVDAAPQTLGTLANAEVMRVGRLSGAGTQYADMEFQAAAIWRRALTAGEIAGLNRYFQNRAYNG